MLGVIAKANTSFRNTDFAKVSKKRYKLEMSIKKNRKSS